MSIRIKTSNRTDVIPAGNSGKAMMRKNSAIQGIISLMSKLLSLPNALWGIILKKCGRSNKCKSKENGCLTHDPALNSNDDLDHDWDYENGFYPADRNSAELNAIVTSINKLSSKQDFLNFFKKHLIEPDEMFNKLLNEEKIRKNIKLTLKFVTRRLLDDEVFGNIQWYIESKITETKYLEIVSLLPHMPPRYSPIYFTCYMPLLSKDFKIPLKIDPYLYEEVKEDILLGKMDILLRNPSVFRVLQQILPNIPSNDSPDVFKSRVRAALKLRLDPLVYEEIKDDFTLQLCITNLSAFTD